MHSALPGASRFAYRCVRQSSETGNLPAASASWQQSSRCRCSVPPVFTRLWRERSILPAVSPAVPPGLVMVACILDTIVHFVAAAGSVRGRAQLSALTPLRSGGAFSEDDAFSRHRPAHPFHDAVLSGAACNRLRPSGDGVRSKPAQLLFLGYKCSLLRCFPTRLRNWVHVNVIYLSSLLLSWHPTF